MADFLVILLVAVLSYVSVAAAHWANGILFGVITLCKRRRSASHATDAPATTARNSFAGADDNTPPAEVSAPGVQNTDASPPLWSNRQKILLRVMLMVSTIAVYLAAHHYLTAWTAMLWPYYASHAHTIVVPRPVKIAAFVVFLVYLSRRDDLYALGDMDSMADAGRLLYRLTRLLRLSIVAIAMLLSPTAYYVAMLAGFYTPTKVLVNALTPKFLRRTTSNTVPPRHGAGDATAGGGRNAAQIASVGSAVGTNEEEPMEADAVTQEASGDGMKKAAPSQETPDDLADGIASTMPEFATSSHSPA